MTCDPDTNGGRTVPSPERLRQLVDRHYGAVRRYAARRLPSADADDLVSEVFAIAWRRINDVPDDDRVLPWLYAVAHNCFRNHARSAKRRLRLVRRIAEEPVSVAPADDSDFVRAALARLAANDQELLRLVAWEDLPYGEIARVLEVSENAVAIRVHRARQRLAQALVEMQRLERSQERTDTNRVMRLGEDDG